MKNVVLGGKNQDEWMNRGNKVELRCSQIEI